MNRLGLPDGTRWAFAGQGEDQQSSFRQLVLGIGVSILLLYMVLMYMVLVVLCESWLRPVLILTALPLASVGAFLGLLVFQRVLSLPARSFAGSSRARTASGPSCSNGASCWTSFLA